VGGIISATVTGQGTLGGGRITDTFASTDASGQAQLAIQAGNADGKLDFSVTAASTDFQFSSRKGRSVYAAGDTTDGLVIQLDASKGTVTASTTVAGSAATQGGEITAVKADVKAVSDTVATLSKAVATIQSSVTELTTSFTAQIKSLSAAIAKISKAIAALSKKIK
jgi:phage shock protein A